MSQPVAKRIATCFGIGYFRPAPGTWGSAVALPLAWAIEIILGPGGLTFAALVAALAGVWAGGAYAAWSGKRDPKEIVIDEVAGQWLTLAIVAAVERTLTPMAMLIGFLAFRFFDIVKPRPARQAENLRGGWGVMADDLVAGAYAGLTTLVALWLIRWFG
ncbi:MAG: phosphatidylglycerophosphatase A [Alphaproteobacteria bacterium]